MIDNVGRKITLILSLLAVCVLSLLIGGFRMGLDLQGGTRLRYSLDFEKAVAQEKIRPEELQNKPKLLQDVIDIWRQRIDPQGIRDVGLRTLGEDSIIIEIPGSAAPTGPAARGLLGAELDVLGKELVLDPEDADVQAFPPNGGQVVIGDETIRYARRLGNQLLNLDRGYMLSTPSAHSLGDAVELIAVDPWRELIENEGSLSFFIAAGPQDLGLGTDLASETGKAKAWVRDNYPALPISDYNATLSARTDEGAVSRLRFFPMKKNEDTALVPDEDLLRAVMLDENPRWQFSGADVHTVFRSSDSLGLPAVGFRMADNKLRDFGDYTEEHEGEAMAIVINDEIVTFPVIEEKLPGRGIIKGGGAGFKEQEVQDLITVLRSGSLRLAPTFVAQETVGATLGAEYVKRGFLSAALGLAIVLVFMMLYYRRLGVIAAISLICNLILLTGALAFLQATLTLPGVAGIILTVGMAVDANILIYERIREEALRGRKPLQAAKDGFANALSTIVDANLTTLITGLILYKFGTGPVRGFATTLSIGILTSMFSALVITRVLVHLQLEKGITHFSMARFVHDTKIRFMAKSRNAMIVSGLLIAGGLAAFMALDEEEKFGIDFLGGMTMSIRTATPETKSDIEKLVRGIEGVVGDSAEIKPILNSAEGDGYTHFRITAKGTSLGLEEGPGDSSGTDGEQVDQRPKGDILQEFRGQVERALSGVIQKGPIELVTIEDETASGVLYFEREHPPADLTAELAEIGVTAATVTLLTEPGAPAYRFEGSVPSTRTEQSLRDQLGRHFMGRTDSLGVSLALAFPFAEVSAVGAQVVAELRDNAIFAILLSLFAAVMYIRVRFAEYSFGVAAVVALTHDVLITLGALALVDHFVPFIDTEINLPMVAAFLTIIGYSLNDTIVVFDRVRENLPRMKGSLSEIIDKSINQTLSRTLLTSATTLISVTLLLAFNLGTGNVLEGFAFALLVGVLVGTYSSIFIASPVLLWLETRRQRNLDDDDPTRRGSQSKASAAS